MSAEGTAPAWKPRLTLVAIVVLFAAPLLAAWLMTRDHAPWAGHTVNRGQLLEPRAVMDLASLRSAGGQVLPAGSFERHWTLVGLVSGSCEAGCDQLLYWMRQSRQALGRNSDRVALLALFDAPLDAATSRRLDQRYPRVSRLYTDRSGAQAIASGAPPPAIYLVDPRGLLVMRYHPDDDRHGIVADLERLLKASVLG